MRTFRRTAAGAAFLLAIIGHPARLVGQSTPPIDAILGIWGGRVTYGPGLAGEIVARQDGARWTASASAASSFFWFSGLVRS